MPPGLSPPPSTCLLGPLSFSLSWAWVGEGGPALSRSPPCPEPWTSLSSQVDQLFAGLRWRRLEEPLGFIKVLQWVSCCPSRGAISGAWAVTLTRSNVAGAGAEGAAGRSCGQQPAEGWGQRQVGGGGAGWGCWPSARWQAGEQRGMRSLGFGPSMCTEPVPKALTFHRGKRTRV